MGVRDDRRPIRLYQFGQVLTGWNPTSDDLFATNWMILD